MRIGGWATLTLCFFLPFARGCGALIETPYKEAFKGGSGFLISRLPFVYPLILAAGYYLLFRMIHNECKRLRTAEVFYVCYFYLLSVLVYFMFSGISDTQSTNETNRQGMWFWYLLFIVLLIFWVTMGFGVRSLSVVRICRRLAIQASTLSLCWILLAYSIYGDKRLLGAYLSLVSSIAIMTAYVIEYLLRRASQSHPAPG